MKVLKRFVGVTLLMGSVVSMIFYVRKMDDCKDKIKEISFSQIEHINQDKYSILFGSQYCGKCIVVKKRIQDAGINKNLYYIDVDHKNIKKTSLEKYKINSVPTIITFRKGKIISKKNGMLTIKQIKEVMED
ncbi:thioredoxin 1 [Kandleria vitulina]|uniref:thioredoxin family protein n=1 Tax=Kandleria vitulina TaxID=1630 RepID=UPI0004907056|nr:thioredoxin family protein [Kandleria vitulina]SDM18556.1 thioredoxin 1 [Kandleria vitulina]SEJ33857.1 thioredoxin 1 [Kandleria vitulina]